jgi:putative sterol carrier protein
MTTFALLAPNTRAALLADLEELWQRFDELVGTLGPDDWSGKHGKHWTFPDVPYHLAYFDLELIVTAIKRGLNVPTSEQFQRTEAEQDAWNEIKFTQRPTATAPEQCLEQMWASRQAIRNAVAGLSEADLERPVFIPLVGQGWVSVRVALETCYTHTWNHLMQLRFWMKCTTIMPRPAQTHRALSYFMVSFARNMNREQAAQTHLTAVMEFSGLDGAVWTLHVALGSCHISEGRAARADLVIVQSPETFVKTRTGIQNPTLALWTGKIQVYGLRNLATFEKLFPITSLDFAPASRETWDGRMASRAEMLVQISPSDFSGSDIFENLVSSPGFQP